MARHDLVFEEGAAAPELDIRKRLGGRSLLIDGARHVGEMRHAALGLSAPLVAGQISAMKSRASGVISAGDKLS
ncbi:hypothetical protein N658DRAFT_501113 [Parathielavia hyrcaniae]|uniref:Uncharacterized protein n=1 Tax=Parathielavia hyrcaniae TaxID=113614 RepID=A0AAN6PSD7_9PEZI|nr:hypothetical protein N658DRAFT_501113 [Parathielavia hyrcaniae]